MNTEPSVSSLRAEHQRAQWVRWIGFTGIAPVWSALTGDGWLLTVAFMLWPAFAHVVLQKFPQHDRLISCAESAATLAVVVCLHAPLLVWVTVIAGLVGGHTALFGLRNLPAEAVLLGLALLISATGSLAITDTAPAWVPYWCAVVLVTVVVVLGALAWRNAIAQHQRGRAFRFRLDRALMYLPESLRLRLRTAKHVQDLPQRCLRCHWVCVVFADLVSFTQFARSAPLTVLTETLDRFITIAEHEVAVHGGVLVKLLGDGALGVFIADNPDQRADVVHQALRCGRRLARHTGFAAATPPRRVGIASGLCYLGDWGAESRLDHTVIGVPVNLAARLQQHAPVGGILVCERTVRIAGVGAASGWYHVRGFGRIRAWRLDENS